MTPNKTVSLHGRTYNLPTRPTVVVCIDGFDPEYLQAGCEDGILPVMSSWLKNGFAVTSRCAMPSLTIPNNLSIITGQPTSVHRVAGNYFLDRNTGEEHMILDDANLRGSTILAQLAEAGVRVAAITAKDKLRRIINHGLSPKKHGAICFSSQNSQDCTLEEHGITNVEEWIGRKAPQQYSADLSLFVLDAGVQLLKEGRADFLYLTLSDYIQHTYPPRSPEANAFMRDIDERLGRLQDAGALVAVTGDHGMSDKCHEDGTPNVLFLEDRLAALWPDAKARVINPIADPFVKHHGALGGMSRVYTAADQSTIDEMLQYIRTLPEVEVGLLGPVAAGQMEMPADREGDIVVVAKSNAVIGAKSEEHDLKLFKNHRLRSHGGFSEQEVPLLRSEKPTSGWNAENGSWRNFDIFDLVLN